MLGILFLSWCEAACATARVGNLRAAELALGRAEALLSDESNTTARNLFIYAERVVAFEKAKQTPPWPGAEHGKAIIGMSIDGAISQLERELKGK